MYVKVCLMDCRHSAGAGADGLYREDVLFHGSLPSHGDVIEPGNQHGLASYRFAVEAVPGERESISHETWGEARTEVIPYEETADKSLYSMKNRYNGVDYDPNSIG